MTRLCDPRSGFAWRALGFGLLVTAGAAVLTARLAGSIEGGVAAASTWPAAMLAATWAAAWMLVARFRWLTVRRSRSTLFFLALVWALTLSGNEGLRIAGLVLGLFFMVQRRGGLCLLGGRKRMLVFLLGGPLLALTFVGGFGRPDGMAGAILVFCRVGLQVFLTTSLMALLIGMRLHFLRLRPKLMITGILVGVIPLTLLTVFGLVLLYGSLGGSRANRVRDVLREAAAIYAEGRVPDILHAEPIQWDERQPGRGPAWAGELITLLRWRRSGEAGPMHGNVQGARGGAQVVFDGEDVIAREMTAIIAAVDTTAWVRTDDGYWLVRWQDLQPGQARVDAVPLDHAAMGRLARAVRADVQAHRMGEGGVIEIAGPDGTTRNLEARYRDSSPDFEVGWWQSPRYFGTTMLPALNVTGLATGADPAQQSLGRGYLWLILQTSFEDLGREFASTEAALNIVILAALGIIAMVFLLTALTALIFSMRITGGITGAVKTLHRGTQRLASGDLDVVIELENEDEFGDLADSFNAMTVAVRQGREDAIARERLQQEMQTARKIQERLLPRDAPSLAGWEITGVSLPSLQVGGDYFDFLQAEPGRLGVAIGDVSGKGVPAALLMSNLQASLKGQVLHQVPVGEVVSRINQLLAGSTDPHMFATFIYGELDAAAGVFTSANAGHEPPLLVRRDGSVAWLTQGGLLLGMFADQVYEQIETRLEPGDVLVLYTDGITEAGAPNPAQLEDSDDEADAGDDLDDREFGEERLAEVVRGARERSALGIREAILAAVQGHLAGRPAGDDITLVVVKRGEG